MAPLPSTVVVKREGRNTQNFQCQRSELTIVNFTHMPLARLNHAAKPKFKEWAVHLLQVGVKNRVWTKRGVKTLGANNFIYLFNIIKYIP